MDEKTYSDPDVARAINDNLVPVRVDIDRRPDISERYNRGGFPTTAFLSDHGESIWGATFVPPTDMMRIIRAILKAKESGEIDESLTRSRMENLGFSIHARTEETVDSEQLSRVVEDIFSAYDIEFGGFGTEPKFPHPDVLDLLLVKYIENGQVELAEAVVNTLKRMASGLHDVAEGGVFRYSVTRDWQTPRYEKMLETNVGFLRNLVGTYMTLGGDEFRDLATDISRYLTAYLQDRESGGFYGSQDADEEYYKLPASSRRKRPAPSVDKTIYSGWNSDASAVFTLAGSILGDKEMMRAGESSWEYSVKNLWNPGPGLVRHVASDRLYLFEDQVAFFHSLLAQLALSRDARKITLAENLIRGVDSAFASDQGGFNDVMKGKAAIGELGSPRRPLVENSKWALYLAQFGSLIHRPKLVDDARAILNSFGQSEIEAHGVFAAPYIMARWALDRGITVVEIRQGAERSGFQNRLLTAACAVFSPSIVPTTITSDGMSAPFATVCTENGCSRRIFDSEELKSLLWSMIVSEKSF